MPRRFALATSSCLLALAGLAGLARADVTYPGFANPAGLTLNGSSAVAPTADGSVLRLTGATTGQAGSAFSSVQVSTAQFTSVHSFRITNPGGTSGGGNTEPGADGIVFVVQNVANNVGGVGSGIGYQNISPSIGVEYDTWRNPDINDPSQSHVAIDLNGNVNHAAPNGPVVNVGGAALPNALPGSELDDGDRWWSWVYYDGAKMDVYLARDASAVEPALPSAPILTYNVNLQSVLGGTGAFVGFTSATGLAFANHDVLYWRYSESVPEPGAALAAVAAAGALALRCRRARR